MQMKSRYLALLFFFNWLLLCIFPRYASAQDVSSQMLPSIKVVEGQLISISQAEAYFGAATTSTDGLCGFLVTELCVNGILPRSVEVAEIARSLNNDPDLIFEYVYNTIDTEFMFGSHKGSKGTIIDRSGTPFDQAVLLAELFEQAGHSATLKLGTVSLTGTQFAEWTGITGAKAACQLLALGGIPGAINGTTSADCLYAGNAANVSLLHIWVEATVGGTNYFFDPSFKGFKHFSQLNLATEAGLIAGGAYNAVLGGALTGSLSGQAWISTLNDQALATKIKSYATNLMSRMRQSDLAGSGLKEIAGGREIIPALRPAGGWRLATPLHYSVSQSWSGDVPDQYRAKFIVDGYIPNLDGTPGEMKIIGGNFFADEIYGQKLQVYARRDPPLGLGAKILAPEPWDFFPRLALGKYVLDEGPGCLQSPVPVYCDQGNLPLYLRLTADHPFAAESGTYADATIERFLHFSYPITIVDGWGNTSQEMADLWSRFPSSAVVESLGYTMTGPFGVKTDARVPSKSGAKARALAAISWLAQFTRAANLHGEIANGRFTHLHTIGVSMADFEPIYPAYINEPPNSTMPRGVTFADETLVLDVETTFGITLRTPDPVSRRAAVHAIATTGAALEGSILEQQTDSPDAGSTARRFAWGNKPESGETPATTSRKVYQFNSLNASSIANVLVTENLATGVHPTFGVFQQEPIGAAVAAGFQTGLKNRILKYTDLGYEVTTSSEALLGPGNRLGSEVITLQQYADGAGWTSFYDRLPSMQAGGAFVANKYDADGDPVEIAHVILRRGRPSKGGGGPSITQSVQYDPNTAADVLKDEFIDRSTHLGVDIRTGTAAYTTPALDSVGFGKFPYLLTSAVSTTSDKKNEKNGTAPALGDGNFVWNMAGSAQISSSAMEAMGQSRPDMAAETIATFLAMQDIYREPPSKEREVAGLLAADWWTRSMLHNVVTVRQGASAEQYIRGGDGKYSPAAGGAGEAVVTGKRVARRATNISLGENQTQLDAITRVWKENSGTDSVVIKVRSANGDQREYEYWKRPMPIPAGAISSNPDGLFGTDESYFKGHRLSKWRFQRGIDLTPVYTDTYSYPSEPDPSRINSSLGYGLDAPVKLAGTNTYKNAQGGDHSFVFAIPENECTGIFLHGAEILLKEVFDPSDATTPILRYNYDCTGRVKSIEDANAIRDATIAPYEVGVAPGFFGRRQDPLGGGYSVVFLRDGKETRHTDEVGNVTTSLLDAQGRVRERDLPDGQRILFDYDDRNNVIRRTVKPKPSSTDPDLISEASYHAFWNKPSWIEDPKNGRTDFTYSGVANWSFTGAGKGEFATVDQPAVGGVRPHYSYTYNSAGQIKTITDAENTVHRTTYDDRGFPSCTIIDDAGLNIATGYEFNNRGDIVTTIDPRGMDRAWCLDGQRLPANAGGN